MGQRIRAVFEHALHFVALRVGLGLVVGGVAAIMSIATGRRGGTVVVTAVMAIAVVGAVAILFAVFADSTLHGTGAVAPFPGTRGLILGMWWRSYVRQFGVGVAARDPKKVARSEHRDDVLYVSGVVLLAVAALIGYVCSLAGVPPTNPFR